MSRVIKAIYENGVFKPLEPVDFPERAHARIVLDEPPAQTLANFPDYAGPLPREFSFIGMGDSGMADLSERAEELLDGFGQD